MNDCFVDVSYRGLPIGKKVKLTQIGPASGYLEVPTPMPVGTALAIAAGEGLTIPAAVTEVHEQVGGATRPPGMLVTPTLDEAAARAWWTEHAAPPAPPAADPPAGASPPVVTVVSRRMSGVQAVPELADDGRTTAVMDAIDLSAEAVADTSSEAAAATPRDTASRMAAQTSEAGPPIVDDGKRTIAMNAVDLAALGLGGDPAASSGSMPAVKDAPAPDDGGGGEKSKTKRKRKRR